MLQIARIPLIISKIQASWVICTLDTKALGVPVHGRRWLAGDGDVFGRICWDKVPRPSASERKMDRSLSLLRT